MNAGTLYEEKKTLVDKVIVLTEENNRMDQAIMKILKFVHEHANDSQNPLDRILRDRVIEEVLKCSNQYEPDSGTT